MQCGGAGGLVVLQGANVLNAVIDDEPEDGEDEEVPGSGPYITY